MTRIATFVSILALGAGASLLCLGCEDAKVTEKTEVKDRLGGGEKVEKTKVIETDSKVRVEKEQTKIGHDGQVEEQKKTVTEGEKPK
jgi:hypothetical protein